MTERDQRTQRKSERRSMAKPMVSEVRVSRSGTARARSNQLAAAPWAEWLKARAPARRIRVGLIPEPAFGMVRQALDMLGRPVGAIHLDACTIAA